MKGYRYINVKELIRTSNQEVLLKDDFHKFLQYRYPYLAEIELESLNNIKILDNKPKYLLIRS